MLTCPKEMQPNVHSFQMGTSDRPKYKFTNIQYGNTNDFTELSYKARVMGYLQGTWVTLRHLHCLQAPPQHGWNQHHGVLFLISLPVPVYSSISPNHLQMGEENSRWRFPDPPFLHLLGSVNSSVTTAMDLQNAMMFSSTCYGFWSKAQDGCLVTS